MERTGCLDINQVLEYVMKVRGTLGKGSKQYQQFATVLLKLKAGNINQSDTISTLEKILGCHDHLLHDLILLWPKQPKVNIKNLSQPLKDAVDFANRVRASFKDDAVYKSFLDTLLTYKKESKGVDWVYQEIQILFKAYPHLFVEFTRFMADCFDNNATDYEKEQWKSMTRKRRKDFVGKTREIEDPCEQLLFSCEDDRCQLDIKLHTLESTTQRMVKYVELVSGQPHVCPIDIESHFTAINLKCIKDLYDQKEFDHCKLMNQLHKKPVATATELLSRLRLKLAAARKCRDEANKIWSDIYKECHEKMS